MSDTLVYFDDRILPASAVCVSVFDLGFTRGIGVFECFRTFRRVPFHLHDHLHRLERTLEETSILRPSELDHIEDILSQLTDRIPTVEIAFRIIVTAGSGENLLGEGNVVFLVKAAPIYPTSTIPTRAITTRLQRTLPHIKTNNYLTAHMALVEAQKAGANDAIYCSENGAMLELTKSNLFGIREGQLITPKENILLGITRSIVIALAKTLSIPVIEAPLLLDELDTYAAYFQTSSVRGLVPIETINSLQVVDSDDDGEGRALFEILHHTYLAYADEASVFDQKLTL